MDYRFIHLKMELTSKSSVVFRWFIRCWGERTARSRWKM